MISTIYEKAKNAGFGIISAQRIVSGLKSQGHYLKTPEKDSLNV